jgi:hypothetical protein
MKDKKNVSMGDILTFCIVEKKWVIGLGSGLDFDLVLGFDLVLVLG